jgi:hypothetical protein
MPPQLVLVTRMSQKTNQTKTAKKYVRYEDLSRDELIKMLMRLNKRLTRIQGELRDVINILYYGDLPSGPGGSAGTGGYKGRAGGGYNRGRSSGYKYGGKYRRKAPQPEEGGEEPMEEVEGEEEAVEEGPKPKEKPEPKPEAKAEAKPEKGGS